VNLAHCNQLPPPAHDVDEDRAAQLMDASESFKIPMSVGDLQWAEDKEGRMVQKVE
jgi:hypothetical protein